MLARVPLAKQMVDPTDSVLGLLTNAPKPGLNTTYSALIQKAFLPEWWQYTNAYSISLVVIVSALATLAIIYAINRGRR